MINKIEKKLAISENNFSKYPEKNLYLNYLFYLNFANLKDQFNEEENIVNHYSNTAEEIVFHEENCENIFKSILSEVTEEFNRFHKQNFNKKSISLILGHWLKRFIKICYDRYHLLEIAFNQYKLNKVEILNVENFNFSTKESGGIYYASINEKWNYALVSKIIHFFSLGDYEIIKDYKNNEFLDFEFEKFQKTEKKNLKIIFTKKILNSLNFLRSQKDSIVYLSYFPFLKEKSLEFTLGQLPSYWNFDYKINSNFDLNERSKIRFDIKKDGKNIENFIKSILPNALPVSFIEGFKNLLDLEKKFPSNPKLIFSCNAFDMNDLFKVYAASKQMHGTQIISGQHGSGSFLLPDSNFIPELNFSDYYLTWGKNDNKKYLPLFNFKTLSKTKITGGKNFIIYTRSLGYSLTLFDRQKENLKTIETINKLSKNLSQEILSKTKIKLHNFSHKKLHKNLNQIYKEIQFNKILGKNLIQTSKDAKISLFLYNSTGILECLVLNIPFLCFWPDTKKQINPVLLKKFEILKKAKIYFDKEDELINHINNIWDRVDNWWNDSFTQQKIELFNKDLNLKPKNDSFTKLSSFLTNIKNFDVKTKTDDIYPLW